MMVPDFTDPWLAAGAGFVMGLRHAADADHVVAVSTIVARTRRLGSAWAIGAAWGAGHTATLLAAAGAVVLLKQAMPPGLAGALEGVVALALIGLGLAALGGMTGGAFEHSHEHGHEHGEHGHHLGERGRHRHAHVHVPDLQALAKGAPPRLWRSFAVGMLHGLAGSSAIGLALLAAMPGLRQALAYLLVFGLGTLAGMSLLSAVLSVSVARLGAAVGLERRLAQGIGAASVGLGALMLCGWRP